MLEKLVKIQNELKVGKTRFNNFGKYHYRSLEDILDAVKPLCLREGFLLTIKEETKELSGIPVIDVTATITDGEQEVVSKASAGVDINKKGMDIAQSFGASSSYARKYALNGLFLIDDTADADATNSHGKDLVETPRRVTSNKPTLHVNTVPFGKCVKKLAEGATMLDIEDRYSLTPEVRKALTK